MDRSTINNKVRQSNHLIESPYAQEFTVYEIKLFEFAAASCIGDDIYFVKNKTDKEFSISNKELAKWLNTSSSTISHEIERTAARIIKKTMHLRKILDDGSVEFEMINIIPYARYKDGIFSFRLNYAIIPYLVEINKNFTEFFLNYITSMNTAYAIKLYKLLYQYKNIKQRRFSVHELKEQFGIMDKYPQYGDFKKNIITPSINQINLFTDLNVSFNELKLGRKVDKLEFVFELKKVEKTEILLNKTVDITVNNDNKDLLDDILEEQISNQTKVLISQYLQDKGNEYVEASIAYAKRNATSNFDGYLANTLTKGWAELDIKKEKAKNSAAHIKTKRIKQESDLKLKQKELDNIVKSEIEHEWHKLPDSDKANYVNHADNILKKFSSKLATFDLIVERLPFSIYAITNGKYYDRVLESYIEKILKVSMDIHKLL